MAFSDKDINIKRLIVSIMNIVICFAWAAMFWGTVSHFSTYIALALLGVVCFEVVSKKEERVFKATQWYVWGLAMIISMAWTLSDYSIFLASKIGYIKAAVAFVTGWYVLVLLINGLMLFINSGINCVGASNDDILVQKRKSCVITFCLTMIVDLIYVFTVGYPGWVTTDTASQIGQMASNTYTNHHPFWHTRLMESIIEPVYRITGDGDVAIVAYSIFQIVVISLIFTYFVDTLWELKVKKKVIYAIIAFQIVAPYNIAMSCALLKDTAFSFAIMMLLISVYRGLSLVDNKKRFNEVIILLSTVGSCLFRTNGIIAVTALIVVAIVLFRKEKPHKNLLIILIVGWCISCMMNYGYLKLVGVEQPDTVEALSIPLQQIARTSLEGKNLNDTELDYMNSIVDFDKMGEVYESNVSDNVKNLIRNEGNQQIIKEDKAKFIINWISIGVKNPVSYVKGWIDQTRGYWCPSYSYSTWASGISERLDFSAFNVEKKEKNEVLESIWSTWSSLWENSIIHPIEILLAAGLWFWIIVIIGVNAIIRKNKKMVICIVPIALVLSLLIATPVANMFRYVYALFLSLPVIMVATFIKKE